MAHLTLPTINFFPSLHQHGVTCVCDLRLAVNFTCHLKSMASSNLAVLEGKLRAFIDHSDEDDDRDDAEGSKSDDHRVEVLVAILQDACSLIRNADRVAPDFKTIVDRVDKLINSAVDYTYNDGELCDFMPSFAHSEADPELPGNIAHEEGSLMLGMFQPPESVSTGVALIILCSANGEIAMLKSLMSFMKRKFAGGTCQPHFSR